VFVSLFNKKMTEFFFGALMSVLVLRERDKNRVNRQNQSFANLQIALG
jgi:hypothetical protein